MHRGPLDIVAAVDVAKLATVNLEGVANLDLAKDISKIDIVSLKLPPESDAIDSPPFGDRIFRRNSIRTSHLALENVESVLFTPRSS